PASPAAASQLLAALESAGLLERQRRPDDRRRQPLGLTESGAQTLRSARALLRERLAALLTDLPPSEADASPACSRGSKAHSAEPHHHRDRTGHRRQHIRAGREKTTARD